MTVLVVGGGFLCVAACFELLSCSMCSAYQALGCVHVSEIVTTCGQFLLLRRELGICSTELPSVNVRQLGWVALVAHGCTYLVHKTVRCSFRERKYECRPSPLEAPCPLERPASK